MSALAVGATFVCGIAGGGRLWCRGANDQGQLGNGTTTDSSVPVAVAGSFTGG